MHARSRDLALVKELRARTAAPMKKAEAPRRAPAARHDRWLCKWALAVQRRKQAAGRRGRGGGGGHRPRLASSSQPRPTSWRAIPSSRSWRAASVARRRRRGGARNRAGAARSRPRRAGRAPLPPTAAGGGSGFRRLRRPSASRRYMGENLDAPPRVRAAPRRRRARAIARYVRAYADGVGRTAAAVALQSGAADAALRRLGERPRARAPGRAPRARRWAPSTRAGAGSSMQRAARGATTSSRRWCRGSSPSFTRRSCCSTGPTSSTRRGRRAQDARRVEGARRRGGAQRGSCGGAGAGRGVPRDADLPLSKQDKQQSTSPHTGVLATGLCAPRGSETGARVEDVATPARRERPVAAAGGARGRRETPRVGRHRHGGRSSGRGVLGAPR